jgi:hypothetical protein
VLRRTCANAVPFLGNGLIYRSTVSKRKTFQKCRAEVNGSGRFFRSREMWGSHAGSAGLGCESTHNTTRTHILLIVGHGGHRARAHLLLPSFDFRWTRA